MKPKLLGLSIASSALLAAASQTGHGTTDTTTVRVTIPSTTVIQTAQIAPSTAVLADDDSPNHQSHASHDSHSSHYSSSGQLS
jgi:hypothetical protein